MADLRNRLTTRLIWQIHVSCIAEMADLSEIGYQISLVVSRFLRSAIHVRQISRFLTDQPFL